jgi:hypothetical protein
MQAVPQGDGRHNAQIRFSLPTSRTGHEPVRHPEGPRGARRQHVFRVTYCTVLAEWSTAMVAVGLLSFYLFAILDAKEDYQKDNINYKVGEACGVPARRTRDCPGLPDRCGPGALSLPAGAWSLLAACVQCYGEHTVYRA